MELPMNKDLQDLMNATTALKTIHDLLNAGMFQGFHSSRLKQSIAFIEALHGESLNYRVQTMQQV